MYIMQGKLFICTLVLNGFNAIIKIKMNNVSRRWIRLYPAQYYSVFKSTITLVVARHLRQPQSGRLLAWLPSLHLSSTVANVLRAEWLCYNEMIAVRFFCFTTAYFLFQAAVFNINIFQRQPRHRNNYKVPKRLPILRCNFSIVSLFYTIRFLICGIIFINRYALWF